jgi:hypothetical protein
MFSTYSTQQKTPIWEVMTNRAAKALRSLDARPGLLLGALCVMYLTQATVLALGKRLWYDEVLGLAVSSASSWREVVAVLTSGVDYNPPLYYYATRVCVLLLGDGNLAVRLPAIVGMLCFLVCLFRFAARRMPAVFAALAFMLVMVMPARNYSFEARPYGLLLGFTGVVLLAYQDAAAGRRRSFALPLIGLGLAAVSLCHYYGFVVVLPLLAGELVRLFQRRRFDVGLAVTFLAPLGALMSVSSVIRIQRSFLHNSDWSRSWREVPNAYIALFSVEGWVLVFVAAAVLAACLLEDQATSISENHSLVKLSFPLHELALLFTMALLPVFGMALAKFVTHTYIARYFLAALAGLCIIFAALFRMLLGNRILAPYAALFCLLTVCGLNTPRLWSYFGSLGSEFAFIEKHESGELPIVIEDAKDSLFVWRNYPGLRSRTWFLADPGKALRIKGYDTDDIAMLAYQKLQPVQVATYQEFVRTHRQFLLFSRANPWVGWNVDELLEEGASVRLKSLIPGGGPAQATLYAVDLDH